MRAGSFNCRGLATLAGHVLLVVFGSYAFCWGVIALCAAGTFPLGAEFHDGEILGVILALLLYPVALLWAFAARSQWRVSVVLAGCSSICGNLPQFFAVALPFLRSRTSLPLEQYGYSCLPGFPLASFMGK